MATNLSSTIYEILIKIETFLKKNKVTVIQILYLWCARHWSLYTLTHLVFTTHLWCQYKKRNWGPKSLKNVSKFTQLVSSRVRIWLQAVRTQSPRSYDTQQNRTLIIFSPTTQKKAQMEGMIPVLKGTSSSSSLQRVTLEPLLKGECKAL